MICICTCVIFNKHVPILFGWQLFSFLSLLKNVKIKIQVFDFRPMICICTCVIFNKHVPILFGWQLKYVFRTTFECVKPKHLSITELTLYLIETPFNTFANRADPDQAALVRAA